MRWHTLLIKPFYRIETHDARLKAEIAIWLVFARTIAMFLLLANAIIIHNHDLQLVTGATVLSIFSYFLSRTPKYEWAILIIVVEPLIAIPAQFFRETGGSHLIWSVPVFMAASPLIASFVLTVRQTTAIVIAGCIASTVILLKVSDEAFAHLFTGMVCNFIIAALSLLGCWLRVNADRAVENARANILQSSRLASLGEMASGIAHELNSPLGALLLNAEMARDDLQGLPPEVASASVCLREIEEISIRMGSIISGLKHFSQESADEKIEIVQASRSLDDALMLCSQRFQVHKIAVECDLSALAAVDLSIRRTQISQLMLNLLNNSFDATKNLEERWVRITGRRIGSDIQIIITDSGSGIPKNEQARIFEPFFTTKDYGKGSGLGLSIAKGIAQAHEGDLIYDATSLNTRFILRLPQNEVRASVQIAA